LSGSSAFIFSGRLKVMVRICSLLSIRIFSLISIPLKYWRSFADDQMLRNGVLALPEWLHEPCATGPYLVPDKIRHSPRPGDRCGTRAPMAAFRSEERRVGKDCSSRCSRDPL